MLLPNVAALITLLTITTASPTPLENKSADNGTFSALVKYTVYCRSGGNTLPRCYEGGSAGCRCTSYGIYNCQDAECKKYCSCEQYVLLNLHTPTIATHDTNGGYSDYPQCPHCPEV
jgi:hypothetical protein